MTCGMGPRPRTRPTRGFPVADPVISGLPAMPPMPGAVPVPVQDDEPELTGQELARETALTLYRERGLPALEEMLKSEGVSKRMKLDVIKELRIAALPPPEPKVGDQQIMIVLDL